MARKLMTTLTELGRLLRRAGPYVLLEIVLPGGTLFALGLYLYRNGQLRSLLDVPANMGGLLRCAGGVFDQLALTFQPLGGLPAAGDRWASRDGLEPLDMTASRR